MRAPRFYKNEAQLVELSRQAKQWPCPSCGAHGTLNRHGALRGCAEDGKNKEALRGRRFFCSNRQRRRGCGRTFSVRLASAIAHATVCSQTLWRFYQAKFKGSS